MTVDRHVDARTAMRTSLRVTVRDLPAMLVWAALVSALVVLGFATALFGRVVIFASAEEWLHGTETDVGFRCILVFVSPRLYLQIVSNIFP